MLRLFSSRAVACVPSGSSVHVGSSFSSVAVRSYYAAGAVSLTSITVASVQVPLYQPCQACRGFASKRRRQGDVTDANTVSSPSEPYTTASAPARDQSSVPSHSHPSHRRIRRDSIPDGMSGEASRISAEFEFTNNTTATKRRPTFLRPEEPSQQHQQQPTETQQPRQLSEAVSSMAPIRSYNVRTPCHPASLFSLPVLNHLRALIHSRAFQKMVIRASIDPRDWSIEPEWDFNNKLDIPTTRQHPNWMMQQEMMARSPSTNPAILSQDIEGAVSASTQEPFKKIQIEENISDFILSPHLHQSQTVLDAVMKSQSRYFNLADQMTKQYASMPTATYNTHERKVKKELHDAWVQADPYIHRAVVDQFIKFMEDPIDETPNPDTAGLTEALAKPPSQDALLKSRSGRLRFDPSLVGLSNLSAPHEWYQLARSIPRKLIIHVGPTNSGKTYHAMQRLMSATSGVYAGPLRLLAWEVYDKMLKKGVPCNLLTGQESHETEGACHTSSTVEMISTNTIYDVAVIDECQMLSANDRGWAWTRALLGVAAYEVHVCGDPSMVELVEELASITGEEVEIREYERLTPLHVAPPLHKGIQEVRKGDCIVAFSQKVLYRLKHDIEHGLGLKCCIIYGSLPPETRRDQAEKFNSPDSGYDVLVATDAIGMGLNLNIQRIIFARMDKFDGSTTRALTVSETLQIAGRAGRFNTNRPTKQDGTGEDLTFATMEEAAESNAGFVTTLVPEDHAYLTWALQQKLTPLERAGLAPTQDQLETLHALRPKEKLSNLVTYFAQYAQLDQTYFNVDMESFKAIADLIEHVPFTSVSVRYDFCRAPSKPDGGPISGAIIRFAELFAAGEKVFLKSYKVPAIQLPTSHIGFSAMEDLYAITDLYVWLGLRFGEEIFVDIHKAIDLRQKTAAIIQSGLERISPSDSYLADRRNKMAEKARTRLVAEARRAHEKAKAHATHMEPQIYEPTEITQLHPSTITSASLPPPTSRTLKKSDTVVKFVGARKDRPTSSKKQQPMIRKPYTAEKKK